MSHHPRKVPLHFFLIFLIVLPAMIFQTSTSSFTRKAPDYPADEAYPNFPGLSSTGKAIEKKYQKYLKQEDQIINFPCHKRTMLLKEKAEKAEKTRNYYHERKIHLDQKLEKAGRSIHTRKGTIFSKIPLTMEAKRNHAKKKKDENMQILHDIANDTELHIKHNHVLEQERNYINQVKHPDTRRLGYKTPVASPPRDEKDPNPIKIKDFSDSFR